MQSKNFLIIFAKAINTIIMFSKACEYGIRAVLYIAEQSEQGVRIPIKEIAKAIDSPEAFTAKILQQLARNQIVDSVKGPSGGFSINKFQLETLKLRDIVSAIDGDHIYNGCGLGLPQCSEDKPCPVHHKFASVRNDLRIMLDNTTILELAEGLKDGLTFLKH